jgi:hypothetical protein
MSVSTVTSSTGSSLAALLSAGTPSAPSSDLASSNTLDATPGDNRRSATNVQLSDQVKATLAQAESNKSVAQKLQTLVEAGRAGGSENPKTSAGSKSTTDVDQEFQALSGGTDAGSAQTPAPVQVVRSFDSGLKSDGYTISAIASDQSGSSRIQIVGPNGFSFLDEHFGWSDEFVTGSGSGYSDYQAGNVEYISTAGGAAASSSTTTSSSAGSTSSSSSAAQASTTTIAINFTTGQISVAQAAAAQATTTAQVRQPTPSFSTVA